MNVGDVVTSVKRIFGDEGGVQITDDDIIRWINKAQHKILLDNPGILETTVTANSVANQAEYDFPTDLDTLHSIQYDGFHLQQLNLNDFNNYIDGYSKSTVAPGVPQVYTIWNNKFTLYPKPSTAITGGIKLFYVKQPPAVDSVDDALSVPEVYHNAVETYCLRMAYELDESPELAALSKSDFDEDVMKLNDRNKRGATEQYPMISRSPEPDDGWFPYGA